MICANQHKGESSRTAVNHNLYATDRPAKERTLFSILPRATLSRAVSSPIDGLIATAMGQCPVERTASTANIDHYTHTSIDTDPADYTFIYHVYRIFHEFIYIVSPSSPSSASSIIITVIPPNTSPRPMPPCQALVLPIPRLTRIDIHRTIW